MKFDFSVIQNPVVESITSHSITGTLPTGETVTVSRQLNHWNVNLRIVIGDMIWHDSPALPPEQTEFNNLRFRALNIRDKANEVKRDAWADAGKILMKA